MPHRLAGRVAKICKLIFLKFYVSAIAFLQKMCILKAKNKGVQGCLAAMNTFVIFMHQR